MYSGDGEYALKNSAADQIARIDAFAALSPEDREAAADLCRPITYDTGAVLAREGGEARRLFTLLSGTVEIWIDFGTKRADLLAVREAPCLVGEISIADQLPRSATITASTDVRGFSIDSADFRKLLSERGSISLAIMKGIARIVRDSNNSFVSELRGRNRELMKANQDLKDTQRLLVRTERLSSLGKFSSMIIHDLRNPLSVIKGYVDMLEFRLESSGDEDLRRFASQIRRETIRLTGLTNEWLDYSRGEIRLSYSPARAADLFDQVRQNLETNLAAKELNVSWTSTFDGKLMLDTERILRVLINLVDNAYKACSRGGRINVEARKEDDNLRISVKDDGIGMDSETQRHIFDPFYSKSERGGTGLGLHIVGTVVSAHGGTVDIQSASGTGTEVSFTLPLRL